MTERVHVKAVAFGGVADEYERARPGYPAEAVAHLVAALGLGPGAHVADIGAGTGKLTRLLTASGARVSAVEPVEGMRARLVQTVPGVEALDGTAEALPFADNTLDGVTVAQAVHWFGEGAAAELARVLRPGGAIAIVYNRRDRTQHVHDVISTVRERVADGAPSTASGAWRPPFERCALLEPEGQVVFPWSLEFTHAGVLDQARSMAPIAALDETRRLAVLDEIAVAFDGEPDRITLRYTTEVDLWRRAR
jgi:SAM-dependent methyltransferase